MSWYLYRLRAHRPDFAQTMTDAEMATMQSHIEYWRGPFREGRVLIYSPVADPDGSWGMCVIQADSESELEVLRDSDPAFRDGVGDIDWLPLPFPVAIDPTPPTRRDAPMSSHPVNFFEIVSDDAPRLHTFYSDLFGWKIEVDEDGFGLVDTGAGEDAVGGGIGPKVGPNDSGVKIYVKTDDLEATLERAKALGSTVYLEPMNLPGDFGRIAVVSDPDRNPVGLWS